ncbi:MAG: IPTL-CTERM sorting domain-containing protein [Acidovorax sp.]|uniref:IPTL-CTERM sorting domain-containing protein n=1 Tax=Acidovorax sp. TaxID=1872122 RepID=UPI002621BFCD|nr:IPTL-CTERM sorting domain-containing protein [Acidovorax sp.]MDH4465545.1 IPTL-CTERM sorting domain-containing protein [Acidovorax sp.]
MTVFKKMVFRCFLAVLGGLASASVAAQTTLAAGDMAIIGLNYDVQPQEMAIVTLVPISAGTTIRITDYAYDEATGQFSTASTGNTAEGSVEWTTTSAIAAGTVIKFSVVCGSGAPSVAGLPGTVSVVGWTFVTPINCPSSPGGDNWFIYQGASPTSVSNFVFGWTNPFPTTHFSVPQVAGQFTVPGSGANNIGNSYLPPSLTLGTSAIALNIDPTQPGGRHGDNNIYTGIRTGTKAALQSAISDPANWSTDETAVFDINPGGVNFLGANPVFTITTVNGAPTDISLSAGSVNENVAGNSTVGSFSTTDPDAGNTFTYTLVAGTGSTDNAAFSISGSALRITSSPDFETQSSYSVRVRTTDQGGLFFEKTFTITINNVNEAPTNINLSASAINENVAANSAVGTFSTTDVDAANTFNYTLAPGAGDTDNSAFSISGSTLQITSSPDFETKSSYSVRVRSTDQGSLTFERAFTITVNDVNEAPTNINLSASAINENVAANSTVGTFSTTDADAANTFTYTLVAGAGSTDNAAFNITGSSLRISSSPDFETKSSYSVRVRSADQGGLFFERAFTITVTNVNEAPSDISLSASAINENVAANSTVGTFSTIDVDAANTFTYALVAGTGSTDNGAFSISGSSLRLTSSPDFETKSSYSVRVRSTDQGSLFFEKQFTITVTNVNEPPSAGTVAVTGTVQAGLLLTGSYVYSDPENDAEGTSTFRWVRNSVNTGIGGGNDVATTLTYTPVAGDQGQYLYFCVTPVAGAGVTTGALACSAATAQVPSLTNGACAVSAVPVAVAPVGVAACTAGSVSGAAATASQFTWGCAGSGGGTSTAAAACSVPRGYNVTPSAGANGAITPGTAQVVAYNSSTVFTVTPNSGYVANVTGTCGGNLSGATYTTNAITGACTVNAAFTPTTSMANIPTRQGGVTATLSAVGCTAVGAAVFVDAPAAGKPTDKSFPYGLIDFTLTGCAGSADVTITYSQAIPSGATYYKELAGVYSVLPATISGNTVRFTLADNGAADADAAVGTIRDPSGLALGAGAGLAAIPTLSEWGLILLSALMVGFRLLAARRRSIQRA